MKKLMFALALGALLVLALATTAVADNGPHGGFTATTDACAGCHRAHSAKDPAGFLLIAPVESICLACHDGTGAYTNVVDGVYQANVPGLLPPLGQQGQAGYGLFGGGFTNAAIAHTWNGKDGYDTASVAPSPSAVTSTHNHDGIASGTTWGSGDINSTAGGLVLECTSCHDPHGNAGRTGNTPQGAPVPSYRLLRFTPNGSNGFETTGTSLTFWNAGNAASTAGITVVDTDKNNKWYTLNNDVTLDGSLLFYRSRWDGVAWTPWSSYIAGRGDYAGRNYVYQRPAAVVSPSGVIAAGTTGLVTCKDAGGNLPPYPTGAPGSGATATIYPCGATPGTLFNNGKVSATGVSANAGRAQLGYWCGNCHDRYVSGTVGTTSGRTTASGDNFYMYRHNSTNATPCIDCHVAHGTTSVMTNTNSEFPTASLTTGSILMKVDERSICLKCHGHSVNFGYVP